MATFTSIFPTFLAKCGELHTLLLSVAYALFVAGIIVTVVHGFTHRALLHLLARNRAMPQAPLNEVPVSSLIRASPVRNAFGGQVIGSTARLRRWTSGSGSPVKSIRYR